MFPEVQEFFFDDDTFTADLTRAAGTPTIVRRCNLPAMLLPITGDSAVLAETIGPKIHKSV